jgi:hypothetical protein
MENEESKKSHKQAIIDFFKALSPPGDSVGRFLAWVLEHQGYKAFVGLLFGGALVSMFVFLGWWPEPFISKKCIDHKPPKEVFSRSKATEVDVKFTYNLVPYRDQEPWLHDHIYYLEKEGDQEKQGNQINDYVIAVMGTSPLPATSEFFWVLTASPDFSVCGRAYKKTARDSSRFFAPLAVSETLTPLDSIRFAVPPCEKGDSLFAIVRISAKKAKVPQELRNILRSSAE